MGRIHPSSVVDGLRLEQHDPRLFLCTRFVFHPAWHHNHVSLPDAFRSVAEVHGQFSFEQEEELVFVVVGMPHKIPLNLRDFHVLSVQGGHHPGVPVVVNQVKFGGEVDWEHGEKLLELASRYFVNRDEAALQSARRQESTGRVGEP